MTEKPIGNPYSQVYLERGAAVEDSARFRARLREYLRNLPYSDRATIAERISEETGAHLYDANLAEHFTKCSLVDLLDNITHALNALEGSENPGRADAAWYGFVERALRQENVGYVLDKKGGVHPAYDEEFVASRLATIAALDLPRYRTAREYFEQCIADLKPPLDTRDAVRKVFEAVENVAKLITGNKIARLGAAEVEKNIKPLAMKTLTGAERDATHQMLTNLANWVNACQQYRHAPGTEEPGPPSLALAIWMVSVGAAHLRWLVDVDQKFVAKV